MRLLVHGLQASGASALTMLLAQRPGCVAVVDVPFFATTPRFGVGRDALAKCVVTTEIPLQRHIESFRPDKVVLALRDPVTAYASATTKGFRDGGGRLQDKLRCLDGLYRDRHRLFDAVIRHEDLCARRPEVLTGMADLGWHLPADAWELPRGIEAILGDLLAAEPELFRRGEFSFGDARPAGGIAPAAVRAHPVPGDLVARVRELCPALAADYGHLGPA